MRNSMTRLSLCLLWSACAPPPVIDLVPAEEEPTIVLLYPEPGQILTLDASCALTEPLVVYVEGVDLGFPDDDDFVEGRAHWHGGPDLAAGFCVSTSNVCADYDGTQLSPGTATLRVELQDDTHDPLPGDLASDQVEIRVEGPVTCP